MPELPEVETVRLQLKKYLEGHRIEKVDTDYKRFEGDPQLIEDSLIKDVRRFGKVLSIDFENGKSLVIHIKMTGQLIYRGPNLASTGTLSKKVVGGVPGKHTHATFRLDKGGMLYYNDVRKFGWLRIMNSSEVESTGFVGKLGPEPFKGLTIELFKTLLSKSKRPIKLVIMDQEKMGGVGNIYANDALWLAKIDPKTPSADLTIDQITRLYDAILKVLEAGIKYGGASELAFVTPDGEEGEYQNHTLAYGHDKELCARCKKVKLEKYFLGGRGTYWCPNCQK